MRGVRRSLSVLAVLVALAAGPLVSVAQAAPFSVTTTANTGAGSLRQAILNANATAATDSITFAISPAGAHVISLTSPLPLITQPVVINGQSQPGFSGSPLIQLDNATGSASAIGVDVRAGASTVSGLSITRFGTGMRLRTGGTNTVTGDWLGLDTSGAAAGNAIGLKVAQASDSNRIGGITTAARNVISGNSQFGLELSGTGTESNLVRGNRIGTNPGGTAALSNGNGIVIDSDAGGNTVGGTTAGARNLISGNINFGVSVAGTTNNVVAGNRIGPNAAGTAVIGNSTGVVISGPATGNTIGGATVAARNLISGNDIGLSLSGAGTSGNTVAGNYFGTNAAGSGALGNIVGLSIGDGAHDNTVGGTASGAGNVISASPQYGVWISGSGTMGNLLQGNRIGTNAAGTAALANGQGIRIDQGASGNIVGGDSPGARNLISGQFNPSEGNHFGVWITDPGTSGNTVAGNYIGTDVAGTGALANYIGVVIGGGASGNTIGGTTAGERNVMSGNYYAAVRISGADSNTVAGNYMGTDPSGTSSVANGGGVELTDGAKGNTIGGLASGARNVISGNQYSGLIINAGATGNTVAGNYIGTDASGLAALGNGYGLFISAVGGNTIGGTTAAARNVISGNGIGVFMEGYATGNNPILGNYIGTDASGSGALGNGTGVLAYSFAFGPVGGTASGAGNTIAFNTNDGVTVDASSFPTNNNTIERNSIFSNGGLGIHLVAGANDGQASPTITSVGTSSATTIKGKLLSVASTSFRIELFDNPACDPSGAGEGKRFLGAVNVTTNGTGHASFSKTVSPLPSGRAVTATATNLSTGDTSQFSACFTSP